ncbi:ABC-three component system middle component 1 [Pseudomonas sp. TCU-HL1]|uniref:ABC-three component system middle component 1 n=1 Tax=Pseudomonas sp. TCU-HL1 TaxID=1856685 RepID=UPI0011AB421F|nr:ABC-three component system middle component 1 [Pseudomonas sp. TCU-HL1]
MSMSIKDFDFTELQRSFPSVGFGFYESEIHSFISCILCEFETAQSLVDQWESIQNFVSVYHQPKVEAARWNVYLILLCPEDVDVRGKYIIQNDTYTARKLIVEREPIPVENSRAVQILNNELLGFDLKADFSEAVVECNYQSAISDFLEDVPFDSSASARSIRAEKIMSLINFVGKS